jgi:DHA2 family multidrug resistance protein-like MFS transporter
MIIVAPRSARLVESRGSRFTLLLGFSFCLLAFLVMLILWDENASYFPVGLGYLLMGVGVGFAGTPASRSLTGSVPVRKAGMASGTADLQRDLGGAILQSVFGALLTAGYAKSFTEQIAASPHASNVSDRVSQELTKSFSGAVNTARIRPGDCRRSPQVLPRRRRLDLRRGHDRRRRRHQRRLLPLPQARPRDRPVGPVPHRRHLSLSARPAS